MTAKPTTIDDYLAALPAEKRAALEHLRQVVRVAAPDAVECISYQMPAFKLNGMLVGFAAHLHHCSLYAWNKTTIAAFADQLQGYELSDGTIRFTPDRPIPEAVVRHLVQAKAAANAERAKARKSER